MSELTDRISSRRTFGIISHPDAGKTTLTEQLLLFGGAIQMAGTVKARKASRHATSDWMELEKSRGISVTSSVMQFEYQDCVINLLDTPGHADFSEDTYRTLTAVDSALMVIDVARGVEERTIKLMEVCRLRDTPIMTFINKMDREGREPLELLDEVETVLKIRCVPLTWPIGMGKAFRGVYRLYDDRIHLFASRQTGSEGDADNREEDTYIDGLESDEARTALGELYDDLVGEIELVAGAGDVFDRDEYLAGRQTPVFFGSALRREGIDELLENFITHAPAPLARETESREVDPLEDIFTGFVFKIQANMDPAHHDRIAFVRVASGEFTKGMKLYNSRLDKTVQINNASTFMAARREAADTAVAGDIIGMHNHGTIQIGDTFTEGEKLRYTGIPNFAPELFRRVRLRDPLRAKQLQKGLIQLSEEGATQVFRPLISNDLVLGAVGVLQFDVVAHRLQHEYGVDCSFEGVDVSTARWLRFPDAKMEQEFRRKAQVNLALDGADALTYIAPNMANLRLTTERWPDVEFLQTREV